jgi:hypothetical protein
VQVDVVTDDAGNRHLRIQRMGEEQREQVAEAAGREPPVEPEAGRLVVEHFTGGGGAVDRKQGLKVLPVRAHDVVVQRD